MAKAVARGRMVEKIDDAAVVGAAVETDAVGATVESVVVVERRVAVANVAPVANAAQVISAVVLVSVVRAVVKAQAGSASVRIVRADIVGAALAEIVRKPRVGAKAKIKRKVQVEVGAAIRNRRTVARAEVQRKKTKDNAVAAARVLHAKQALTKVVARSQQSGTRLVRVLTVREAIPRAQVQLETKRLTKQTVLAKNISEKRAPAEATAQ